MNNYSIIGSYERLIIHNDVHLFMFG